MPISGLGDSLKCQNNSSGEGMYYVKNKHFDSISTLLSGKTQILLTVWCSVWNVTQGILRLAFCPLEFPSFGNLKNSLNKSDQRRLKPSFSKVLKLDSWLIKIIVLGPLVSNICSHSNGALKNQPSKMTAE